MNVTVHPTRHRAALNTVARMCASLFWGVMAATLLLALTWPLTARAGEPEISLPQMAVDNAPELAATESGQNELNQDKSGQDKSGPEKSRQGSSQSEQCVQRDDEGRFLGWMDYEHCSLSDHAIATARWFDDMFGDWDDNATLLARAITEIRDTEGEGVTPQFRLRVSAALPNARQKLRLIVTDDSADPTDRLNNQEDPSQVNQASHSASAAVRWINLDKPWLKSNLDLGVRGLGPPDVFTRWRLRSNWNLTQDSLVRLSQTFRYGSDSKGRSLSQLDLEWAINEDSVAHFGSAYEYLQTDHAKGFNWGQTVFMSRALSASKSVSYGFTLNGYTQPDWRKDNYGPWLNFRSSFLRDWLFYEVEPRLTFYRDKNWDGIGSLTLRLEIQFGRK